MSKQTISFKNFIAQHREDKLPKGANFMKEMSKRWHKATGTKKVQNMSVAEKKARCSAKNKVYSPKTKRCQKSASKKSNSLMSLSYYEYRYKSKNKYVYVNAYPDAKTTPVNNSLLPENGSSVFSPSVSPAQLKKFLISMADATIGFLDTFWMVPAGILNTSPNGKPTDYMFENILGMLNGLVYKLTAENKVVIVHTMLAYDPLNKATFVAPNFKTKSTGQSAVDTFVVFNKKLIIISGKTDGGAVRVQMGIDVLNLQSKPPKGAVIPGEHVEQTEIAYVERENKNMVAQGLPFIKLERDSYDVGKDGKATVKNPAVRAVYEEVGFTLEDLTSHGIFNIYFIGVDDKPGRDYRYWPFGKNGEYGYRRKSISYMFCVLWSREPPKTLPTPADVSEVSKVFIISIADANAEFRAGGLYPPAFPSHERMYRKMVSVLPFME